MGSLPTEHVIGVLLELFSEAYDGPSKPYSWFTESRPGSGLFGTVAGLSATEASTPVRPGGTTIAAHLEHLRWSLALANAYVRGEEPKPNWKESWLVHEVDQAAWDRLQADLRQEYDTLTRGIAAATDWFDPMFLTGTMALVPHAAYHLGAIRQMIGSVRQ